MVTGCNGNTTTRVMLETLEQFELSISQVNVVAGFLHVMCKVHTLHAVAETIRQCFANVDTLLAGTKKQRVLKISQTSSRVSQQISWYSRTTTPDAYSLGNMVESRFLLC
ncbi:hypothetical protein NQ318_013054 [Aromia moschata]|uniref:Uncharacterized protein n=1 Tax=Aromia moschata TaxID=1265417 RepID=A0AAV8XMI6_9CUCU|nr:hypothetical protein NQ318_013054 [Aromia moschata]